MHNSVSQTILSTPHFDQDGVIAYQLSSGKSVHLVYAVAQQAMLGKYFVDRYMGEGMLGPYAEFVDTDHLPSPVGDSVAEAAARWLRNRATETADKTIVWLHDFDFVFKDRDIGIPAQWVSAIGQANALLACMHWWKHSGETEWSKLAAGVVASFSCPANTRSGVAYKLYEDADWFEEYPTQIPSHILNCHLLSLIALERAGRLLNIPLAGTAFERGWHALIRRVGRYDRFEWSRYDTYDDLFIFLRLLPTKLGRVAIGRIELQTASGSVIRCIDAPVVEVVDQPISRLAGIDWGAAETLDGRLGRVIPNSQDKYASAVPEGGTDQNTYLIFEEGRILADQWVDSGVKLVLEVYLSEGTQLEFQPQDPREGGLRFISSPDLPPLKRVGWHQVTLDIPPRLIGRVLPRHYHRLHTELLGTLLAVHPDPVLDEVMRRWFANDFYDAPRILPISSTAPRSIYVFVNDRCGLRCKMCDVGMQDQEAVFSTNLTQKGRNLDSGLLIRSLRDLGQDAQGVSLCLTGTEPLLYSQLYPILKAAKSLGMLTHVTTNGLMLQKAADDLAEAGLDQLTISIDGPPLIHDEVRQHPGLFSKVVDGFEALKQACATRAMPVPKLAISFAISYDNHLHVLEFMEAIRPFHPSSVSISHLNYVAPNSAQKHNISFPAYPIAPSSVTAWEAAKNMDYLGLYLQLEQVRRISWTEVCIIPYCPTPTRLQWYYQRPELPMSRPVCAATFLITQILADGSLTVLGRCFDVSMGNLATQSIKDIWDGEKYSEFRSFVSEHPNLEPCLRCCGSL